MNITSMLRGANTPKCIMKWGLRTLANSYLVIGITIFLLGLTKTYYLKEKKPSWKDIVVVHLDTVTKRKLENV